MTLSAETEQDILLWKASYPFIIIFFLSVIGISVAPWSSSNERGFPCVMSCPGSEQDDGHHPAEFKAMAKPEDTQTHMDRRTTGQQSTDEPPGSISQQNQCITVSPLPVQPLTLTTLSRQCSCGKSSWVISLWIRSLTSHVPFFLSSAGLDNYSTALHTSQFKH